MFRAAIRLARPAALLAIAAVAVACVGSAGAAGSTPSPKPVDPDKVIFRVSWEGGFVTPETLLARLPTVVVYADGRVITQGPVPMIYPGPFMPNLQERTLSPDALDRLIALAREKDLLKDVKYDFPGIADAADTVLEINLDGKSYRLTAYALAEAGMEGEIAPAVEVTAGRQGRTDRDARVHRRPDGRPRDRLRRPAARLRVRSAPAVREAGRHRRQQRVPGRAAADRLAP